MRPTSSYDLVLAASGDIDQSLMAELWWASPGNRCPSIDAEPVVCTSTEFSLTPTAFDISDSVCVRMYAAALGPTARSPGDQPGHHRHGSDGPADRLSQPWHGPVPREPGGQHRGRDVRGRDGRLESTVRLRDTVTGHWVAAKVTYSARWLVFTINPVHHLLHDRIYQVVIRPGIRDRAGNALRATTWRFTTHR